jgi:aquaporin Z
MVGKRFSARDLPAYVVAQVLGGMACAAVLYVIATGKPGFELGGFACNGFAENSPGGYSLEACLVAEVVLTFMFLMIILGSTDRRAPQGFAPIAIGLGLTLIHLIGIPVTNLSVNPARSTGPAVIVGGWAIRQLWLFWLAGHSRESSIPSSQAATNRCARFKRRRRRSRIWWGSQDWRPH